MVETFDRPVLEMQIDPQIFPLNLVLLAAYYLVNRLDIRILGDPDEKIHVSLTTRLKHQKKYFQSKEEILWAFNERLVRASLDEHNLEKNADIRHAFLRAAFLFEMPETDLLKPETEKPLESVTSTFEEKEGKITLTVNPANNPLRCVLMNLFSVAERVKDNCCFVVQQYEEGQIFCEIFLRQNTDPTMIWNQIASELEKRRIRLM